MHLLKSEHSCGNCLLLIVAVRQAISCYCTKVTQGAIWRPACRLVSIGLATAAARGTVLCQKPKPTQQFNKLLDAEWILYSTRGLVINELLGEGHTSKGGKKSLLLNNSIVPRGVIQYSNLNYCCTVTITERGILLLRCVHAYPKWYTWHARQTPWALLVE
jgi:hypothetical protein